MFWKVYASGFDVIGQKLKIYLKNTHTVNDFYTYGYLIPYTNLLNLDSEIRINFISKLKFMDFK